MEPPYHNAVAASWTLGAFRGLALRIFLLFFLFFFNLDQKKFKNFKKFKKRKNILNTYSHTKICPFAGGNYVYVSWRVLKNQFYSKD